MCAAIGCAVVVRGSRCACAGFVFMILRVWGGWLTVPDEAGNIKGISLAGVKNAWLDGVKVPKLALLEPDAGCTYPSGERCGVRCWDIENCAYLIHRARDDS